MKGYRKLIIFIIALVCFTAIIFGLKLTDPLAIAAVGTAIAVITGATIYGNIKEHQNDK